MYIITRKNETLKYLIIQIPLPFESGLSNVYFRVLLISISGLSNPIVFTGFSTSVHSFLFFPSFLRSSSLMLYFFLQS
jgi:hypothetical protein